MVASRDAADPAFEFAQDDLNGFKVSGRVLEKIDSLFVNAYAGAPLVSSGIFRSRIKAAQPCPANGEDPEFNNEVQHMRSKEPKEA